MTLARFGIAAGLCGIASSLGARDWIAAGVFGVAIVLLGVLMQRRAA